MFFDILLITFFSCLLLFPLIKKPLYCDDGNWFYLSIFKKRGLKLYNNYFGAIGFFGIEVLASLFCGLIWMRNIKGIQIFRITWYYSTVISIYLFTYIIYVNQITALIASLIFLITYAYPKNKLSLTYGESMILFPIILSCIFAYLAYSENCLAYILISGLFVSVAINIKVIGFLYVPLIPIMIVIFFDDKLVSLLFFLFGVFSLIILPIAFIRKNHNKKIYLYYNFYCFFNVLKKYFKFLDLYKFLFKSSNPYEGQSYVENIISISKKKFWTDYKHHLKPIVTDWQFLIMISFIQIVLAVLYFELLTIIIFALFINLFLFSYIQNKIQIIKLNQLWFPISVLVAKGITSFLLDFKEITISSIFFISILTLQIVILLKNIIPNYKKEYNWYLANYGSKYSRYFYMAKEVGEFIKLNSKQYEKILSWGNMPSVYLYADRECIHTSFFHIYPTGHNRINPKINELFDFMKNYPPEWITFFTGIYPQQDKWNINTLMDEIFVPYKTAKVFPVEAEGKQFTPIPVYRRDDYQYKAILLENYYHNKDTKYLDKVLEFYPEDQEVLLIKDIEQKENIPDKIIYINNQIKIDEIIKSKLLGELYLSSGDLGKAESYFSNVLLNEKQHLRSIIALGEIYFARGEFEPAFKNFEKAIKINRFSIDAFNNIGVVLYQLKDYKNAKLCFEKVIKYNKDHKEAKRNIDITNNLK